MTNFITKIRTIRKIKAIAFSLPMLVKTASIVAGIVLSGTYACFEIYNKLSKVDSKIAELEKTAKIPGPPGPPGLNGLPGRDITNATLREPMNELVREIAHMKARNEATEKKVRELEKSDASMRTAIKTAQRKIESLSKETISRNGDPAKSNDVATASESNLLSSVLGILNNLDARDEMQSVASGIEICSTITIDGYKLRMTPSLKSAIIRPLDKGQKIRVIEKGAEWSNVALDLPNQSLLGWVNNGGIQSAACK